MPDEIVPHIWIGDLADARVWRGAIICVMNAWPEGEPAHALWLPIMAAPEIAFDGAVRRVENMRGRALVTNLNEVAALLEVCTPTQSILVHCRAGRERSPLAVAWYLSSRRYSYRNPLSLVDAYALLKAKRPVVEDRREWLP